MHDSEFTPTILIVDDTPQNLQLLASFLHAENYKVAAANSGISALKYLQDKTPDLILLDVMMPQMNGYDLCKKIKKDHRLKTVPIIFVSAKSDTTSHIEGFQCGGVDFVTKPFVREILLARIKVHLQLKYTLEKLQSMSITDDLTGTYNRRYAIEILNKTISLSKRRKASFVLCYLDLNYLKKINDSLGHAQGDEVIITLASDLIDRVRTSDSVFRMGGDEFMILFPDSKEEGINSLMENLVQITSQKIFGGIPLSFSYGLSEFNPASPQDANTLIREADSQMYQNKQLYHEQSDDFQ